MLADPIQPRVRMAWFGLIRDVQRDLLMLAAVESLSVQVHRSNGRVAFEFVRTQAEKNGLVSHKCHPRALLSRAHT